VATIAFLGKTNMTCLMHQQTLWLPHIRNSMRGEAHSTRMTHF